MEINKALLLLCLCMGVTIAYKTLGILNDKRVPHKPNFHVKRNKEAAEDLPEPRRRLSHLGQASHVNTEDSSFNPYCLSKGEPISRWEIPYLRHKDSKFYIARNRPSSERVCLPPNENSYTIDNVRHEICKEGVYCYQEIKPVIVLYECFYNCQSQDGCQDRQWIFLNVTLRTDCRCGVPE